MPGIWILIIIVIIIVFLIIKCCQKEETTKIADVYIERENNTIEQGALAVQERLYRQALRDMIEATERMRRRIRHHMNPAVANNITFVINRRRPPPRPAVAAAIINPGPEADVDLQIAILQSLATNIQKRHAGHNKKEYFEQTKKVKSDGQNVHDTAVNMHLRDTFARLEPAIGLLDEAAMQEYMKKNLSEKGYAVVHHIMRESPIVYSLGGEVGLKEVLMRVWHRAAHPKNEAAADAIRKAVVAAIEDCYENGSRVCTGGITARLLGALVLLDFDKEVGHVETMEQYKNDILSQASAALEKLTKEAESGSFGEELAAYAKTSKGPEPVQAEFRRMYSERVDAILVGIEPQFHPHGIKKMIMAAID